MRPVASGAGSGPARRRGVRRRTGRLAQPAADVGRDRRRRGHRRLPRPAARRVRGRRVGGSRPRRPSRGGPVARPPSRRRSAPGRSALVTIETAKGAIEITIEGRPVADRRGQLRRAGVMRLLRRRRLPRVADSSPGRDASSSSRAAIRPARGSGGPGYEIQDEPVTTAVRAGNGRDGPDCRARTRSARSSSSSSTTRTPACPVERQHVPDHRLGDEGHGDRRRDHAAAGGVENPPSPSR